MSLLIRSSRVLQRKVSLNCAASYGSHAAPPEPPLPRGNREVVGYGCNGLDAYLDRVDFPMPAVRFKNTTPDVQALREKEKGDWKKLTVEEKKQLYRASFCQTFAEMNAPTGEWKSILGCTLGFLGLGIFAYLAMKFFVVPRELPKSFSLESQQAQLRRMIDLRVNPIEGISSRWDYEKDDWKK